MKVIVCGGRDYKDRERVFLELDRLPVKFVIEGGQDGADALAQEWACVRGIPCATVHAWWGKHGKAAGPIRNAAMLELKPDLVLAFPGGKGTASMRRIAADAGVPIQIVHGDTVQK